MLHHIFPCYRGYTQLAPDAAIVETQTASSAFRQQEKRSCFSADYWNWIGMILEFVVALFTNSFFFSQFEQYESCEPLGQGPLLGYSLSLGVIGTILGLWSTTSVYCHYLINKHEKDPDQPIVPSFGTWVNDRPSYASALITFVTMGDYLGHIADVVSGFTMLAAVAGLDLRLCAIDVPLFLGLVLTAAITSVANVRTCLGHFVMESGSKAWINGLRVVEGNTRFKSFVQCLKSDWWTNLCLTTESLISVPAYSSLYAEILASLVCFWAGDASKAKSGPYVGFTLWQFVVGLVLGVYSTSYAYSQSRINSQSKDICDYKIVGFDEISDSGVTGSLLRSAGREDASSAVVSPSAPMLSFLQKVILAGTVGGTVADITAGLSNIMLYVQSRLSSVLPCWAQASLMLTLIPVGLAATIATLWTCYQTLLDDAKNALRSSASVSSCCCVLRDVAHADAAPAASTDAAVVVVGT